MPQSRDLGPPQKSNGRHWSTVAPWRGQEHICFADTCHHFCTDACSWGLLVCHLLGAVRPPGNGLCKW